MDFVWEFYLQGHQQADGLQLVTASVNIIAQKQVVVALDISSFTRLSPQVKEPHQVLVLAMDIPKHFDRCIHSQKGRPHLENPFTLRSQC